ncbi:MAG TPA: hypothetical protein GX509_08585 [Firmicutes bacterium]|nr:hypothetical protein [Bacillota bacterium]HHY98780.1 hypothetical protein [Bacillota bacterium]
MTKGDRRLRTLGPARDVDNASEAIAEEMSKPRGTPRGREVRSQKSQLKSGHSHGTNKAIKVPIQDKR